ncbi:MAG: hypothetical protein AAF915_17775 [Cyanobacteria bacterium P01_D01_bin.50]
MAKFTWLKKLLVISIVASVNFPITSNAVTNLVTEKNHKANIILLSKKSRTTKDTKKTSSPSDWLRNIFRRKKRKSSNAR